MHVSVDLQLVDKIVNEVKSQGVFDQFRKDSMADVDTKPAYQNLRQRVESTVSKFLSDQKWRPDLNKFQLREKLRKHIVEAGFLDTGVERIVDQVVNPKISTVFQPKIEDIAYKYLGIEKPHYSPPPGCNGSLEVKTDLLPTDLEAVSPDSDKTKSEKSDSKCEINELFQEKNDEFESPPFEPLESSVAADRTEKKEDSDHSQLSGISGLTSQDSISNEQKVSPVKFDVNADTQNESQLSEVSSNSRLSIVTTEESETSKPTVQKPAEVDISEEAQMPKFNDSSEDTKVERDLHFDIKREDFKFEGTERKIVDSNLYSFVYNSGDNEIKKESMDTDRTESSSDLHIKIEDDTELKDEKSCTMKNDYVVDDSLSTKHSLVIEEKNDCTEVDMSLSENESSRESSSSKKESGAQSNEYRYGSYKPSPPGEFILSRKPPSPRYYSIPPPPPTLPPPPPPGDDDYLLPPLPSDKIKPPSPPLPPPTYNTDMVSHDGHDRSMSKAHSPPEEYWLTSKQPSPPGTGRESPRPPSTPYASSKSPRPPLPPGASAEYSRPPSPPEITNQDSHSKPPSSSPEDDWRNTRPPSPPSKEYGKLLSQASSVSRSPPSSPAPPSPQPANTLQKEEAAKQDNQRPAPLGPKTPPEVCQSPSPPPIHLPQIPSSPASKIRDEYYSSLSNDYDLINSPSPPPYEELRPNSPLNFPTSKSTSPKRIDHSEISQNSRISTPPSSPLNRKSSWKEHESLRITTSSPRSYKADSHRSSRFDEPKTSSETIQLKRPSTPPSRSHSKSDNRNKNLPSYHSHHHKSSKSSRNDRESSKSHSHRSSSSSSRSHSSSSKYDDKKRTSSSSNGHKSSKSDRDKDRERKKDDHSSAKYKERRRKSTDSNDGNNPKQSSSKHNTSRQSEKSSSTKEPTSNSTTTTSSSNSNNSCTDASQKRSKSPRSHKSHHSREESLLYFEISEQDRLQTEETITKLDAIITGKIAMIHLFHCDKSYENFFKAFAKKVVNFGSDKQSKSRNKKPKLDLVEKPVSDKTENHRQPSVIALNNNGNKNGQKSGRKRKLDSSISNDGKEPTLGTLSIDCNQYDKPTKIFRSEGRRSDASPTPSELSVSSKENEFIGKDKPGMPSKLVIVDGIMNINKPGSNGMMKVKSQRYSSEDLYKPRPLSQRPRRREMLTDSDVMPPGF